MQNQPLSPSTYPARPMKDRGIALVLEILPGLFGFFGIGWIYSGNSTAGIVWLLSVLAMNWIIMLPVVILTAGFGVCCSVPTNLVLLGISAYTLNSYTKQHTEVFGP